MTNTQEHCEHLTHPWLLSQVSVHLLLTERCHFLYLPVVALHPLLVLWDLLGVQQLVGRGVLIKKDTHTHTSVRTLMSELLTDITLAWCDSAHALAWNKSEQAWHRLGLTSKAWDPKECIKRKISKSTNHKMRTQGEAGFKFPKAFSIISATMRCQRCCV